MSSAKSWPENVGIVAIEIYFPSTYVDQTELEMFDEASTGKYTEGLGQKKMGFCTDREDINSLCMTVVSNLLDRHKIPPARIGRLDVGTGTIIDRTKSVKSVMMELFEPHGVTDLEGVDTTNGGSYNGTAALLHAINWVESSSYNGRYALVVCGDIAVCAEGSDRPTGGAGAVAMLVGPNAPLVMDLGLRATYMHDNDNSNRSNLASEGYLNALDNCYQLYCEKARAQSPEGSSVGLDAFDAVLFHTPYCKLVQKSLARLGVNDYFMMAPSKRPIRFPGFEKFNQLALKDMYADKDVETAFMTYYEQVFQQKTAPSLLIASQVGNMYTASVYSGLVSFLISNKAENLVGKKVALFSYGSDPSATMYSMTITSDVNLLRSMVEKLSYVAPRLDHRKKISPTEFSVTLEMREHNSHKAPYDPAGSIDSLFPGTFYLRSVDHMHRRVYERLPK